MIESAVSEIEADIDFFVRDEDAVHLCVHSTCPYCDMAFGSRNFLIDHLDYRNEYGSCFSS
jgi:hypothetical protein